jgi:hypothetical protein
MYNGDPSVDSDGVPYAAKTGTHRHNSHINPNRNFNFLGVDFHPMSKEDINSLSFVMFMLVLPYIVGALGVGLILTLFMIRETTIYLCDWLQFLLGIG